MTVTEALKVIKMFADDNGNVPFSKVEEILKMTISQSPHIKGISIDGDLYNREVPSNASAINALHKKYPTVTTGSTKSKSIKLHDPLLNSYT